MRRLPWCMALAVAALAIWARPLPAADQAPSTAAMPAAPNSAASGSDWPQWHGPNRNNFTSENITWPAAGPKQLWTAAVGDGFSGISVSKGRAYTMGNSNDLDTVWCFDARTGAVVWKYSYPTPNQYKQFPGTFLGTRSTPTIDGPLVYTVSRTGSLFALDAAKGTVVWSADYFKDFHGVMPRWGFAGSPLVEGKLLIVNPGGKGASVVAFDKSTGQVVWKTGDEVANYASPVIVTVGGQRILAMMLSNGVHGYNLADGKELWKTPVSSKNSNGTIDDPVVLGDKLFLPEYDGNSYALYKVVGNSVEEVYVNKKLVTPGFPSIANAALIGGLLYGYLGPFDRPAMICLDPETGDMKWKKDKIGGPFLAAGNKLIYIRSETGKAITDTGKLVVAEASPDGYKEIGSTQALPEKTQCWTAPSLANGLVYCRNTKGDVVCLDLSGK